MAFRLRKPPPLNAKYDAYPYQLDAVRAVQHLPYSAIFHEQGLGKTKIAIDLILHWLSGDVVDTVFIVTKKILVPNWVEELKMHSHVTPQVLSGNRKTNSIALNSPVLIYVMNYEVVSTNLDLISEFLTICRVGVFLDESQKIKNPASILSHSFFTLSQKFSRRVIISGTPVANRPYDIWAQIKFLDNGTALGNCFSKFKADLDLPSSACNSIEEYGQRLSGIMEEIRPFVVRETKETAGLELPDKIILSHFVELAPLQFEMYVSYRDEMYFEFLKSGQLVVDNAEEILKRLLRLVQCASNPGLLDSAYSEIPAKLLKLTSLIEEVNLDTDKVIVWTGFIENVEWLFSKFQNLNPQKLHGSMPMVDRTEAIRKFKVEQGCKVLFATPGAAKEGLTLTVANHAVFFDRSFSLDDYVQAQDRIHRISQNDDCFIHNIISRGTVDEWVDTLLNAKYKAAQLAQGDISSKEFETAFACDLKDKLSEILASG